MFTLTNYAVFTIFMVASTGYSAPISEESDDTQGQPAVDPSNYLSQFGYLPEADPNSPSRIISDDELANAIRDFQTFMGLPVTGELDDETKEEMSKPRCGIKDKAPPNPNGLSSYKLGGSRWKKKLLSYAITKYPRNVDREETDRTIREAFNVWSRVTPLRFVRKTRLPVHIEIRFERGKHGNCSGEFDGPYNTLAHAYYPIYGGDAHFDDSEPWTLNSFKGINLLQTAAHEFGHALGLDHSGHKGALMYPSLQGYQPNFELHEDDIKAIQRLYPATTDPR